MSIMFYFTTKINNHYNTRVEIIYNEIIKLMSQNKTFY